METLIGLVRMIVENNQIPLNIRVVGGGYYSGMIMVHRCCELTSSGGVLSGIRIVAQGKPNLDGEPGPGPFVFIYPAEGVNPDQPACLGMPVTGISF